MSDSGKKRWLVKDGEGRVRGPYYTDDILKRIKNGEFSGEEQISLYPGAEWSAITKDPTFYDKLLEILEGAPTDDEHSPVFLKTEDIADDFVRSGVSDAKMPEGSKKKQVPPAEKSIPQHTQTPTPQTATRSRAERVTLKQTETASGKKSTAERQPTIELKSRKKAIKKATAKKATLPLLVATIALLGVVYYIVTPEQRVDDRIHLLAPRKGQPALDAETLQAKQKQAVGDFVKDNFSNYVRAEEELVQIVEANPKNQGALALLCLDYLELWPYAYGDSKDLSAVTVVAQMASANDAAGYEAATCRAVDFINRGRFSEAKGVADTVMDSFSGSGQPPIAFYYIKARLFDVAKDFASAISYAQTAEQSWPQWLRAYSFEARLQSKNQNFSEAANRYRGILKANPAHRVSQIELGVIEYQNLQNYQEGKQLLESAMRMGERVPRDVLSRGYLGLAEIDLREQNSRDALANAQRAYSLNSSELRAKEIILQIGGEKKLRETRVLDTQLVYEGDQLVREGDCNGAQAHFKEAFESNHKNGIAAMKAAQCLWDLSLSTEAIEWLNKAIAADPNLIDAYVLLADYFAQRFNYEAAGQVLAKAKMVAPNSNKVYSGYAQVEFRRNNFAAAITYATKAIQIYETDVESYVILGRALIQNQEYPKAFEAASKAVELDINNKNGQIVYAEALGATRGLNVGIDYLTRLVATYPTVSEYRMSLGQMYARDQSYTSAEQVFDQVIRIEDKPKQAYLELGKVLQLEHRYDDALAAFFKAAELDPADVEPLYLAGLLYLAAKKPSEARIQFQHVLKINKDYPLVNYQIGRAALDMDSPQEALEQAKIEIIKNPNLADPYILAADAHTAMKQYDLCAADYLQAVKVRSVGADFYIKMARCYRLSGNVESAQSMINQASRQESGNPELWKEQGAIYETQEQRAKAIEAYNQYLTLAPNAADRDQVQMRIKTLSQ